MRAIVVLGGDGTHRVVAKACGEIPLCAISTGTNNAFPELRETTVAGLAVGAVATERAGVLRRESALTVSGDIALVDVAVSRERFVGARAIWRPQDISELFVTFASPSAIGLSAIAGALEPLPRGGGRGLHVTLGEGDGHGSTRPGAGGAGRGGVDPGDRTGGGRDRRRAGTIALDGERELERRGEPTTVRLVDGPLTIDIDATLAQLPRA